ncbi:helix-turn-helix domain-containing protein [Paractinoplanes durhamensis]|uniref:HTH cro/C1-type domain-containing protein n=1 Tax=Paractinoplanes durhamensis TaxID=113563 RepID=A0ABQ3YUA2_9ACTN|nr:helix-turn-helix transcriptional regulator [Actinoplanes durhamensis]GIE01059.1 hypothetical protein Adu01nite_24090 [Actinoplanes durhamensis]
MADIARHPRPLLRTLVGEVLRRNRQEQRRTLAEVSREASVSVQYLSEVERGRKEPSSEILAAVCDALRIDLSDLLAEVRHDLELDRAATLAPVLRLGSAFLGRSAATPPAQQSGGGQVMLLAA